WNSTVQNRFWAVTQTAGRASQWLARCSSGSVSLGAWFCFAFLAAVLCELCGKEGLNREERQGFAKDAKQVLRPRGKLSHYPSFGMMREGNVRASSLEARLRGPNC